MKVQAGTPMTEVIKQYAELSGIDEAECRFLVGFQGLASDEEAVRAIRVRIPAGGQRNNSGGSNDSSSSMLLPGPCLHSHR